MSMIKIETHCHSVGGSGCAFCTNTDIISAYREKGYDGIILTNHYSKHVSETSYKGLNNKQRVDAFFNLYKTLKNQAENCNFKVFWGVEIRCLPTLTEYMVLGVDESFLYDNPEVYNLSQEELFALCESAGAFMYQTHPFRAGVQVGDPKCMHGAECFNGHFHHINHNAIANDFCEKNGLVKMYGTDFHEADQCITSYMTIPKDINYNFELAKYFMSGKAQGCGDAVYYETELRKFRESKGRCK